MKKFILGLLLVSTQSFAAGTPGSVITPFRLDCSPQLGQGKERLTVKVNAKNIASIHVNSGGDVCGKGTVKGKFVDYGRSKVVISCGKDKVILTQDYDELSADITALRLGLSDTVFMCYPL